MSDANPAASQPPRLVSADYPRRRRGAAAIHRRNIRAANGRHGHVEKEQKADERLRGTVREAIRQKPRHRRASVVVAQEHGPGVQRDEAEAGRENRQREVAPRIFHLVRDF